MRLGHSCNLISEEQITSKKFTYGCNYILLTTGYFIPRFYYPSLSNQYFPVYPHFLTLNREAADWMPELLLHMLLLNIMKLLQCHCLSFLTHNLRSSVLVTATAHLLSRFASEYGEDRGGAIVSLPDSIRDAFVQLRFGLNGKIDPFTSHTITTSDGLPVGNTCCFKIFVNSV